MSGVASKVLFLLNEHSATEALLGDAFAENGFDIDTFVVVPAEKAHDPAGDVTFPDPLGYDVIVPLGATWAVYNPALLETWVSTEMRTSSGMRSSSMSWRTKSKSVWLALGNPTSISL